MNLEPVAFLSYVRDDDAHEQGRLTEFCKRLAGEVRMQTGAGFEIFQDRNDILWGQQWQKRIEESIDAGTFLVPIITPRYFNSPACRDELDRFLKRERKLNRTDLILPIYYVNSPALNDEKKRKVDRLVRQIADRQYADWRELRFEPFTSPQIGKMLANLAAQVIAAVERGQPTPGRTVKRTAALKRPVKRGKSASRGASAPQVTSASSVSHVETDIQPYKGAKKLTATTDPRTLIVDAFQSGACSSLNSAVLRAKAGDRILVRPGLYVGGLVIDKPLEIIGDGKVTDIVVEASGMDVVLFKATMGRIANLTLRQVGGGEWYGVDIAQGRLDLEDCDLTSESLACVAIHGGADPRLRRNVIHDGKNAGVFFYENSQGTLEDNEIFGHVESGVSITEGSDPTLRRNRIRNGKKRGVSIYENALGLLEENEIFANVRAGVAIKTGAKPILRRNRIHDGNSVGVVVYLDGEGTLENNDIFSNAFAGIEVQTRAKPMIRANRIYGGKDAGLYFHNGGEGTVEANEIFDNAYAGVKIESGSSPTLNRNRIANNAFHAISLTRAGGIFKDNDLRGNKLGAWDIEHISEQDVRRSGNLE